MFVKLLQLSLQTLRVYSLCLGGIPWVTVLARVRQTSYAKWLYRD